MTVNRWTIALLIATVATGLLSWHTFKRYQVMACVDGGGHWDKKSAKCRDRPIDVHRVSIRS